MTVTELDHHQTVKLSKALQELPAAYHQLHLFRLPGSRPSDTGSKQRHGALSTKAVLVLDVLDLLDGKHKADAEPTRETHEIAYDRQTWIWVDGKGRQVTEQGHRRLGILPTLSQWVRRVDCALWDNGTSHAAPADQPTVDTECGWLAEHIGWITQQTWMGEITDDLTRMLRDCTLITGTGPDTIRLTCTNLGCGWPVQEEADGAWFKCTGCGRAWGRLELHRMAERKKPKALAECAKLAGLSERTLRRYVAEKLIRRVARDGTQDLYDIDAVMKATHNLRYRSA